MSEIESVIDGPSAEEELALIRDDNNRNHVLDLVLFFVAGSIGFVVVSLLSRWLSGVLAGQSGRLAKSISEAVAVTAV